MRKSATFAVALAGLFWSIAANAATITVYTDKSLYDAAIAAHPGLTPHDVSLSSFVNPPELDITSSSNFQPVKVSAVGGVPYLSDNTSFAVDTMNMAPTANVRAVAFDYFVGDPGATVGSITGSISVNGAVAAGTTNTHGSPATPVPFFGVISDSPILSIILSRTATGAFQPDQVEFIKGISFATTPIPAALPLFSTALGGLGLLGWRRRKAAEV